MAKPQRTSSESFDQRVVFRNVDWETYERLLTARELAAVPRLTYDRRALEIINSADSPHPGFDKVSISSCGSPGTAMKASSESNPFITRVTRRTAPVTTGP
jgi:hypothetical protein